MMTFKKTIQTLHSADLPHRPAASLHQGDSSIKSSISEESDTFEYISTTPRSDVPDSTISQPVEPTSLQTAKVRFLNTAPGIAVVVSATVVFTFLVAGVLWYYVKKNPFARRSDDSCDDPMRCTIDSELLEAIQPGQDEPDFSNGGVKVTIRPQRGGSAAKGKTGKTLK
jgi:hypothetical protein